MTTAPSITSPIIPASIILHDCHPFKARISAEMCARLRLRSSTEGPCHKCQDWKQWEKPSVVIEHEKQPTENRIKQKPRQCPQCQRMTRRIVEGLCTSCRNKNRRSSSKSGESIEA